MKLILLFATALCFSCSSNDSDANTDWFGTANISIDSGSQGVTTSGVDAIVSLYDREGSDSDSITFESDKSLNEFLFCDLKVMRENLNWRVVEDTLHGCEQFLFTEESGTMLGSTFVMESSILTIVGENLSFTLNGAALADNMNDSLSLNIEFVGSAE